jgi:EpsI family protein
VDRDAAVRALAIVVSAAAVAAAWVLRRAPVDVAEPVALDAVPLRLGAWAGRDVPVEREVVEWLKSDALLMRAYADSEGVPVWILVDYHRAQRLGATVHSPRHCYLGAGRGPSPCATPEAAAGSPRLALAQWLFVGREADTLAGAYWYETRSGATSSELEVKRRIAGAAMRRRPGDVALVRLTTPVKEGDAAGAQRRLARFADAALAPLSLALPFEGAP